MTLTGQAGKKANRRIRLLLVFFASMLLLTLFYIFVLLPSVRDAIYREKELQTAEMVEIGLSILQHYHGLELEGALSRPEAQQHAARIIRAIHYGERGLDYFWINDFEPIVIAHPFRPDLEGSNVLYTQDPQGHYLFQDFIRVAGEQGSGHVTYHWQYYHEEDRFEEKLSFISAFEPWDWIIGTGIYLVDLEGIIAFRRNWALAFMGFFLIASSALYVNYSKSKAIEKKLLESEEKYRLIAENTADTISVLSLDLKYMYVSPAVEKTHGYTPEEMMDLSLSDYLTPESFDRAMNIFEQETELLARGEADPEKTLQLTLEEHRKDGNIIWVENSLSYLRSSEGEIIGILVVAKDVSERIKQEQILKKEQQEKTLILENLSESVTYLDDQLRIVWANRAALIVIEKGTECYKGQKCHRVWNDLSKPCPGCPAVEALQHGEPVSRTVSNPDGSSWRISAVPVRDEKGKIIGVLDTSLDVSDLVKAERDLRQLNEELERRVEDRTAELMRMNRELTAFTYSVSHDLRAPLRSIEGFSSALLEEQGERLDREGRGYLQRVRTASLRMSELIDDLLKLSRVTRQELNLDRINLSAIVEAHAFSLKEKEPQREVEFEIEPNLKACGDTALIRIALENLLDNAFKFTAASRPARIHFGSDDRNGQAVFYLRDNGIGFDAAYAGKIFNAFQRLHSSEDYPGTGIGLSIVQRIIERHGGAVWAEAETGRGATFYFTLTEN